MSHHLSSFFQPNLTFASKAGANHGGAFQSVIPLTLQILYFLPSLTFASKAGALQSGETYNSQAPSFVCNGTVHIYIVIEYRGHH
jgi:hypothetical protein